MYMEKAMDKQGQEKKKSCAVFTEGLFFGSSLLGRLGAYAARMNDSAVEHGCTHLTTVAEKRIVELQIQLNASAQQIQAAQADIEKTTALLARDRS